MEEVNCLNYVCLICDSSVSNIDDNNFKLKEQLSTRKLLHALSKALRISEVTIYSKINLRSLPESAPLFCFKCYNLIFDSLRILEEIRSLESHWSCMVNELKGRLLSGYKLSEVVGVSQNYEHAVEMQLIRKTYAQCFSNPVVFIGRTNSDLANMVHSEQQGDLENTKHGHDQDDENQDSTQDNWEQGNDFLSNDSDSDTMNSISEDDPRRSKIAGTAVKTKILPEAKSLTKTYKCKYCSKMYSKKWFLESHEKIHEEGTRATCNVCDRVFLDERRLQHHKSLLHRLPIKKTKYQNEKTFTARISITSKSTRTIFKKYLTSFQCKLCNQSFNRQDFLTQQGNFFIECQIEGCTKTFTSFSRFRSHHEFTCGRGASEKGFLCEICSKSFVSFSSLKAHKIVAHTQQFTHFCPVCKKGMVSISVMRKHMLCHSEEKKFLCTKCPKSFKRKVQLVFHLRRHDNVLPYLCDNCGKGFPSLQHLKQHEFIHADAKNYPCEICNKLFISRNHVLNHIYSFHKKARKTKNTSGAKNEDSQPDHFDVST